MIKASSHLKKVCAPYSEGWIRIYLKDYGHFLRHRFMHSFFPPEELKVPAKKKKIARYHLVVSYTYLSTYSTSLIWGEKSTLA